MKRARESHQADKFWQIIHKLKPKNGTSKNFETFRWNKQWNKESENDEEKSFLGFI